MLYKCKQTNDMDALYCQGSQTWTFLFGLDMNVPIYAKIPSARGRGGWTLSRDYCAFQVPCRPVFRELHFNNESDWHDILEQPIVNPPLTDKNIMTYLSLIFRPLVLDTKAQNAKGTSSL